jgi:hypothetical protein
LSIAKLDAVNAPPAAGEQDRLGDAHEFQAPFGDISVILMAKGARKGARAAVLYLPKLVLFTCD